LSFTVKPQKSYFCTAQQMATQSYYGKSAVSTTGL